MLQLLLVNFHLSFKYDSCLGKGLFENSHESVEVLFCMLGHNADSKSCLTNFDDWVLDSVDMYT